MRFSNTQATGWPCELLLWLMAALWLSSLHHLWLPQLQDVHTQQQKNAAIYLVTEHAFTCMCWGHIVSGLLLCAELCCAVPVLCCTVSAGPGGPGLPISVCSGHVLCRPPGRQDRPAHLSVCGHVGQRHLLLSLWMGETVTCTQQYPVVKAVQALGQIG